jgi:hypothetical protein
MESSVSCGSEWMSYASEFNSLLWDFSSLVRGSSAARSIHVPHITTLQQLTERAASMIIIIPVTHRNPQWGI